MKSVILFFVNILIQIHVLTPINVARLKYIYKLHRIPHFKNPHDLNEYINYMKFYGDTSRWSAFTDKYGVRNELMKLNLGKYLVKLYGKWDSVDDIDWDKLPNRFVIKCNNGSGDVTICKDKASLDIESTKIYYSKMLKRTFGVLEGEPHYKNIEPCIIVEELLDVSTQPCNSLSLIDYKIWCVNGEPLYIWCCSNREKYYAFVGLYDVNWNYCPEYSVFTSHYRESLLLVPKPACFEDMMHLARILSKGFPVVRVDLYEVSGKVYFGEMTFTSQGGYMDFYTHDFLIMMRNKINEQFK